MDRIIHFDRFNLKIAEIQTLIQVLRINQP